MAADYPFTIYARKTFDSEWAPILSAGREEDAEAAFIAIARGGNYLTLELRAIGKAEPLAQWNRAGTIPPFRSVDNPARGQGEG